MKIVRPRIIALDLEGTLISNAVSQIPRPGLQAFMDFCCNEFDRVCIFSAVSRDRIHAILNQWVSDGIFEQSNCDAVEIIDWQGPHKDLGFVPDCDWREVLIVDDLAAYILPQQLAQWIEAAEFTPPYSGADRELERIADVIRGRLAASV